MDTRTKIVSLAELHQRLEGRPARLLSGHFDPLLVAHVRRLAQAQEPGCLLVVEVTNSAQPLLPQRGRAELVAALSMVDYVLLGDSGPSADEDITSGFIDLVLQRHSRALHKRVQALRP